MGQRFQPKRKHLLITSLLTLLAVGLIGVLGKGLKLNPSIVASTQIGLPAKDFEVEIFEGQNSLPAINNNKINLSALRGRKVILNFWASWCVSCKDEALEMERYWQRYKNSGIVVLGIAIQDTIESAREFAKIHGKTYPLGIDASGKIGIDYGVYGVPESFLINEQGVIVHKEAGPVTVQLLEALSSKFQANQSDQG